VCVCCVSSISIRVARFQVFTGVKFQVVVLWVVAPCSIVLVTNVSEGVTASIFRIK